MKDLGSCFVWMIMFKYDRSLHKKTTANIIENNKLKEKEGNGKKIVACGIFL